MALRCASSSASGKSAAALAGDVIDDATVAQAADQNHFNKATAQRQATMQRAMAQSTRADRSLADIDRRLHEEAMQPGGVGG